MTPCFSNRSSNPKTRPSATFRGSAPSDDRLRQWAGLFLIFFQVTLILSGNLSFLNYLTIVICLSCFDDSLWRRLFPKKFVQRLPETAEDGKSLSPRNITLWILAGLVVVLSVNPVLNMLSPRQAMNRSFDPFHLVNTYGAFGSVGKVRLEIYPNN